MMKKNILMPAFCAGLALLFSSGCSRQKVPPPPKTQPELLLEIYDSARKHQYNVTMLKIQKMRALDPSNIFLAELENTIRFNRMTSVVNKYIHDGKFEAALMTIQNHEEKYGTTDESTSTKEQLARIVQLDQQIQATKAARHSDQLEQELAKLKKITENVKISRGIANFIKKRESVIPELRNREKAIMLWEFRQMTIDALKARDSRVAAVFAAAYAMESPGDKQGLLSLLADPDGIEKP